MTIETEIAALTAATTNLLGAVNVSKSTLDTSVATATAQAGAAATQAGIATTKALESSAFASASQASANNAATAVVSQLNDIKSQTENIRDQAMAGLGAADNSQALAALLGSIAYATDMALQAAREIMRAEPALQTQVNSLSANLTTNFSSYDTAIEVLAYAATHLADLAGVTARAISGGTIELQAGTAAIPSLTSATDVTTGVFFPANGVMAVATAALERLRITADGRMGLGTNAPSGLLDVADSKIRVRTAQTPASATAPGNQGEWAWDANFVYVCTATNVWRRTALAAW